MFAVALWQNLDAVGRPITAYITSYYPCKSKNFAADKVEFIIA